ncbi:hypothetical protein JVX91_27995 [Pseudomonas sp. PDNC002]|uniref:hypothetical protein n=1 Tax=Pseudomonas sp. PDNC002 TaxID=2811422 RepID=UPI0019623BE6|nr:hypothetical protein [Pseudomonas sp. PDNC002]QRY79361.1 hypothetical protein JVX91_27995 [Pseudomonas sp. PDNC002]
MKKLVLCLSVLLFLSGCTYHQQQVAAVEGKTFQPDKTQRIAVSYNLVSKRINYVETLYRVLWLETKTSSQDFSGVWSPDRELSADLASRLHQQGFTADSVFDVVAPEVVNAANDSLAADCLTQASGDHPAMPGVKLPPIADFFLADRQNTELNKLTGELRGKGYRYLVQLTAMDIYGAALGFGAVGISAFPNARVIDLQSNEVVWNTPLVHGEDFQSGGGSLKALEVDGMAKTRAGMATSINRLDFAAMWGLAPPQPH